MRGFKHIVHSQDHRARIRMPGMSERGFSIVIPAHNESMVIERTLGSILANRVNRAVQVIVVANGCSDDTAERARSVARVVNAANFRIEVIDAPVGNKIHALNLGDRAAAFFPRAFLDADIEMSPDLLQRVADMFERDPQARLVAPDVRYEYPGRNRLLAGYYHLWQSLPHVKRNTMARGFYAIDERLRERFSEFPLLTADDKFIRNLTTPDERRLVSGAFTRVHLPSTLSDLLNVKTRWTYGNLELSERKPELNINDRGEHDGAAAFVLARPWLWVHLPMFFYVYWYTRRAAQRKLRERRSGWERDQSTRAGGPQRGAAA
jgi:glycosyltransferase involved in cell wall biosynthesis